MADVLVQHLRRQAEACRRLGSPLYDVLLRAMADDAAAGGPVSGLLAAWAEASRSRVARDAPGLRLLGGAHRLVLERRAPGLAVHYPSVGGTAGPAGAWPALRSVLDEHHDALADVVRRPPQTNEVGRAGPLVGGLRVVAERTRGLPVRLFELGASAGLNLRAEHLPVGPGRLVDTPLPPERVPVRVVERVGADLHPVDPTTTTGRTLLTSYVWPDDLRRLERLRVAFDVAARVPATLRQESAASLVAGLALSPGTVTVVWHSVTWQYVDDAEQDTVLAALERLGGSATGTTALAHLSFEPDRRQRVFAVRLRLWPSGVDLLLGEAPPHGVPVVWDEAHG